jgi:hypothetical protein
MPATSDRDFGFPSPDGDSLLVLLKALMAMPDGQKHTVLSIISSLTNLPDGDSFLTVLIALTAMPKGQKNAVLSLVDFLNNLPKEDLALFAISARPNLTPKEVAAICGVSIRQLYRWERYQSWKEAATDYWEFKRRQWPPPGGGAA